MSDFSSNADQDHHHPNTEIYSKVLRAGRRTYFFDVRQTRADDFYLTITESKKHTQQDGSAFYKKHKLFLYKEDFEGFREILNEVTDYIFEHRGTEVISETHRSDYQSPNEGFDHQDKTEDENSVSKKYTDVSFDDI